MSGQSAPIIVSFTLTRAEFLNAWRQLHTKRWRTTWRIPILGLVLALLGVVDSSGGMIAAGAGIAIWFPLCNYVLVPKDLWRRADQGPQTHTFTANDVIEVLSDSETRYKWRYWQEILLVGDTYVLRSEQGFNFIPRRAFSSPEEEQRFRDLTAAAKRLD